jgi:hypothetical protein
MGYIAGYAVELLILAGICVAQWHLFRTAFAHTAGLPPVLRIGVRTLLMAAGGVIVAGLILSLPTASSWPLNGLFVGYVRGGPGRSIEFCGLSAGIRTKWILRAAHYFVRQEVRRSERLS